jgi:hypothetical protein
MWHLFRSPIFRKTKKAKKCEWKENMTTTDKKQQTAAIAQPEFSQVATSSNTTNLHQDDHADMTFEYPQDFETDKDTVHLKDWRCPALQLKEKRLGPIEDAKSPIEDAKSLCRCKGYRVEHAVTT